MTLTYKYVYHATCRVLCGLVGRRTWNVASPGGVLEGTLYALDDEDVLDCIQLNLNEKRNSVKPYCAFPKKSKFILHGLSRDGTSIITGSYYVFKGDNGKIEMDFDKEGFLHPPPSYGSRPPSYGEPWRNSNKLYFPPYHKREVEKPLDDDFDVLAFPLWTTGTL